MIRRPFWLAAGAALGAGGTVWVQRRLDRLSRRVRPAVVATGLADAVGRAGRGTAERLRSAVDAGRADAQRREDDLWQAMTPRDTAPSAPDRAMAARARAVSAPERGRR